MKTVLLILFTMMTMFAQNSIVIDSIYVQGNEETDLDVITREIEFNIGEPVSQEQIDFTQKRIESLNIFNSVKSNITERNGHTILTFVVVEKLNLFGKPILAFENNDNNKASYGLNIFHTNLRGRNEFLSLTAQVGFKPGFRIVYNNPWILGETHLKYSIRIESFSNENAILLDKKQDDVLLGAAIGKGFGLYYSAFFGMNYISSDMKNVKEVSVTDDFQETHYIYFISHAYNNVDYAKFPKSGWRINHSFSYGHMQDFGKYDFHGMNLDVRHYMEILDNVVFANNLNSNHLGGNPRYYNQSALGQNGLIRGNDLFVREFGLNRTIYRTELRYKFLDDYFLTLPLPYVGKYTRDMRTSMFTYVFNDHGILYDKLSDFTSAKLEKNGYGFGLSVLFPYVYRMSFEFGYDPEGNQKFVFLLNAFF